MSGKGSQGGVDGGHARHGLKFAKQNLRRLGRGDGRSFGGFEKGDGDLGHGIVQEVNVDQHARSSDAEHAWTSRLPFPQVLQSRPLRQTLDAFLAYSTGLGAEHDQDGFDAPSLLVLITAHVAARHALETGDVQVEPESGGAG